MCYFFFLNSFLTPRPKFNLCEDRWHKALCPANLATLAMIQVLHGERAILPTWSKNTSVFNLWEKCFANNLKQMSEGGVGGRGRMMSYSSPDLSKQGFVHNLHVELGDIAALGWQEIWLRHWDLIHYVGSLPNSPQWVGHFTSKRSHFLILK